MAFNQNVVLSGLQSVDVAVPSAGAYFVKGKIQFPTPTAGGGASAVIATITNRTGPTTLQTTSAGSDGFAVNAICAAGDVLRVALTSANAVDAALNAVKCEISIGSGQ